MPHKTNAVRLLDRLGVHYELREYEVDPEDLAATSVAAKIGLSAERVFRTLVALGDCNGISLAVISADAELDLKEFANATGDRKVHLVPVKELRALTGYVRGGVTALAGKKDFQFTLTKRSNSSTSFRFRQESGAFRFFSRHQIT